MSVRLYMDVHVHRGVTVALRRLGVDVVTVGQLVEQLHFVCEAGDAEYIRGRVEYLPM